MGYDYRQAMKLSNQLCFPLYAAARSVIGLYTPHLKPLGLTYTQYIVFLALWERDGLTVGELCDRLLVLCGGQVSGVVDARTTDKRQVGVLMTRVGGKTNEK